MNETLREQRIGEIRNRPQYSEMEVVYKGSHKKLPVHEIPLDLLIYNKYNGRIASKVKSFERQQRVLDASKEEDKLLIEQFLLQSNPGRNKHTQEDLAKNKQLRYGIVTRDGVIIDGNRRAMLLGRIADDRKEKPGYFKAVILEDRLKDNPKEIMRLETVYQLGEDEKLGYNAIEKYLKVKDLLLAEFDHEQIATMMSESGDSIKKLDKIMKLMDSYLNSLGYDGIYTRLDDTEGIFVDLNLYLDRYQTTQSQMVGWSYGDEDLAELQTIFFDLIRARFSGDGKLYRDLGRPSKKEGFFCSEPVWKEFRDFHFKNVEPITKSEKSIDELRQESQGKALDEVLKQRDLDWTQKVDPLLKQNFGKSGRLLDDVNSLNAPLELLNRALRTLETIDPNAEAFWSDEAVEEAVGKINSITYEFRKAIKEKRRAR